MVRSTYVYLSELLAAQDDAAPQRRRRRPTTPQEMQQKVALLRLGHDGNGASELYIVT